MPCLDVRLVTNDPRGMSLMCDITTQLITDLLLRRVWAGILFKIGGLRVVAVAPVVLFHAGVGVFQGGFV